MLYRQEPDYVDECSECGKDVGHPRWLNSEGICGICEDKLAEQSAEIRFHDKPEDACVCAYVYSMVGCDIQSYSIQPTLVRKCEPCLQVQQ